MRTKTLFLLAIFLLGFASGRTRASKLDRIKKQLAAYLKEAPVTNTYDEILEEEESEKERLEVTTSFTTNLDRKSTEEKIEEEEVPSLQDVREEKVAASGDAPTDSHSISLLTDIRGLLYSLREDQNKGQTQQEHYQSLEDMAQQAQASVRAMAEDVERYRAFTDEKIQLVLETFATLRLLVVSQGSQLKEALDRLEALEGRADILESQVSEAQTPLGPTRTSERFGGQRPGVVEVPPLTGVTIMNNKIVDLTRTVNTLQKEVRSLRVNVTELVALSQVITVHEKPASSSSSPSLLPSAPPTSSATPTGSPASSPAPQDHKQCQCDLEGVGASIKKIEEEQAAQRSFADDLRKNLTLLTGQERQRVDSTFTNRLGEVEGSLRDLNAVRREVTAVKENLNSIQKELGGVAGVKGVLGSSFVNLGMKGLCVWPYTRNGDSCFFIQVTKRLNWKAARDYCRTIQGDLAAPASFDDLKNFIGNQRMSRTYSYWLGASDFEVEGAWTWVNGQPLFQNSTLWAPNYPSENTFSNCLSFKPNNRYEILATDEECRISRYFICQQERLV
ncbi:C-type lectin domain family 4 member M-like [Macrobrachium nipponense]|uniref:C-type lectin domain family 4 member M-like n=1 Tax=Macrobrachium nipponense TaxID=159736 RepID=UPI0030C8407F